MSSLIEKADKLTLIITTIISFKEYLNFIPQYHLAESAIYSLDFISASY
jgi:hypothetical protein